MSPRGLSAGYGDISAASYNDVQFSLFAEVAGLAFFALLMEQINRVMHVMQAENEVQNEIKNPIVQFLKWNHVDKSLIKDVVRCVAGLRQYNCGGSRHSPTRNG